LGVYGDMMGIWSTSGSTGFRKRLECSKLAIGRVGCVASGSQLSVKGCCDSGANPTDLKIGHYARKSGKIRTLKNRRVRYRNLREEMEPTLLVQGMHGAARNLKETWKGSGYV
jgi:hypothetical protein